jgi:hypothetical protein
MSSSPVVDDRMRLYPAAIAGSAVPAVIDSGTPAITDKRMAAALEAATLTGRLDYDRVGALAREEAHNRAAAADLVRRVRGTAASCAAGFDKRSQEQPLDDEELERRRSFYFEHRTFTDTIGYRYVRLKSNGAGEWRAKIYGNNGDCTVQPCRELWSDQRLETSVTHALQKAPLSYSITPIYTENAWLRLDGSIGRESLYFDEDVFDAEPWHVAVARRILGLAKGKPHLPDADEVAFPFGPYDVLYEMADAQLALERLGTRPWPAIHYHDKHDYINEFFTLAMGLAGWLRAARSIELNTRFYSDQVAPDQCRLIAAASGGIIDLAPASPSRTLVNSSTPCSPPTGRNDGPALQVSVRQQATARSPNHQAVAAVLDP